MIQRQNKGGINHKGASLALLKRSKMAKTATKHNHPKFCALGVKPTIANSPPKMVMTPAAKGSRVRFIHKKKVTMVRVAIARLKITNTPRRPSVRYAE